MIFKVNEEYKQYTVPNKIDGDCVPRALAKAFGMKYEDVMNELMEIQDADRHQEFRQLDVIHEFMERHCPTYEYKNDYKWTTVDEFCQHHKKGTFLIECGKYKNVPKHLTCVIDGDLYDEFDCSRYYVVNYYYDLKK